jgi:poly-beta-1,6-N-acetyl-D-glucosamine N-deacetylase
MLRFMLPAVLFFAIISCLLLPAKSSIGQSPVYYRDQVAVLMYHHIHEHALSSATITPALFQSQLELLIQKGYQFISLSDLQNYLRGSLIPDNAILVTFDDGYESFYTKAWPILTKLNIPAVNYIITNTLNNRQESFLSYLSYEQIASMSASSNLVEFGCHTDSLHLKYANGKAALISPIIHPDGSKEADAAYQERIVHDTRMCVEKISQTTNRKVTHFAYPYGIYNKTAIKLLSQAGIQYAFTTKSQMTTREANPMLLPRINAGSPWVTPEKLDFAIKQARIRIDHR